MKKIMIMFMMMALAVFASPLFAISESPPNFENTLKTNAGLKNVDVNVNRPGAALADNKVYVLHKDTLMYSWGEGIDNKKMVGLENDGHDETTVAVAVVCHLRGETGV